MLKEMEKLHKIKGNGCKFRTKCFKISMLLLWETFNLNQLVHKSDDHEITEKLIVAIVSEDHKYDHEKDNTAAGLSYLNVLNV